MTENQKDLVQSSFQELVPVAEEAAAMFYARLFELWPEIKPMFKGDMREQGSKLMQMIGYAVASLDNLEELVPAVQQLGKRHVAYGVKDEQYAHVGEALLWTIEQQMGDDFTPEIKDAWATVYTVLADTMKSK